MNIYTEFSKYAYSYAKYNFIQEKVAQHLLQFIHKQPKYILDLGCGDGMIYKKIDWKIEKFVAVDFAESMLELHPKGKNIEFICADFNEETLFKDLQKEHFDYIISASSLQWANNIDRLFCNISSFKTSVALALFTSGTFQTLNKIAGVKSLLLSAKELEKIQKKYFPDAKFEIVQYQVSFDSVREMFRYIKKSGVSGSRKLLSYKDMKRVMSEYPLNYLEFEVLFINTEA